MGAFEWNDHPFYLDQYHSTFILWFDLITLGIAVIVISIAFGIWIYQLFLRKPVKKAANASSPRANAGDSMASKDSVQQSKDDSSKSGKRKVKNTDMSLPTLTTGKDAKSLPENSKSDRAATELSHSNQSQNKKGRKQSASRSHTQSEETEESKKHRAIHPVSKCLVTTSIVCATIYLWCLATFAVLCVFYHHPPCAYYSLMFEIIYVQRICLYFYYFHRLYVSFLNTVYEYPKKKLISMAVLISVCWICGQIFYFVWNSMVGDCTELSIIIAIVPLGVTEMATSIACVYLFVGRLKLITISKKELGHKVQYLISKLTILSAVTIASTFMVLGMFPFTFFLGLMAIDTPINIICLILSFGFYDKYYRMLCLPCRRIKFCRDPTLHMTEQEAQLATTM